MIELKSLVNYFLIVMLFMEDLFFVCSLIYICEYNDEGVMGLVVNYFINMILCELLE